MSLSSSTQRRRPRLLRSRRLATLAFGLFALRASAALVFEAPLERAAWTHEAAKGQCRLAQTIPGLGRAVFEARGSDFHFFYLDQVGRPLPRGHGMLLAAAPFWDPTREERALSTVSLTDGERPVVVTPLVAQRMLDTLADGLAPTIAGPGDGSFEAVRVVLLPVAFGRAYAGWRECQAGLTPARPVAATAAARPVATAVASSNGLLSIRFAAHQAQLGAEARQQLDAIAARLRAAPELRLVIDGHADESRRQLLNLELSRKRADAARDYLVAAGVARDRIECRYHGERRVQGTAARRADLSLQPAPTGTG